LMCVLAICTATACAKRKTATVRAVVEPLQTKPNIPTITEQPTVSAKSSGRRVTYKVQKDDRLETIAKQLSVPWQAMLLMNENMLRHKYNEACGQRSKKFRKRKRNLGRRRGGLYYCNDRLGRPYGNTLQPGWALTIPPTSQETPKSIDDAVRLTPGNRIALVYDDTGSMNDDRQTVGANYMAAIAAYQKSITGVWLFADGHIRRYEPGGRVVFSAFGSYENTYAGLKAAAASHPDFIILITDEPGDDWNWSEVKSLPRVIAHCLRDSGENLCEENLRRLAETTKGQFLLDK
jgi:hypothetical protein